MPKQILDYQYVESNLIPYYFIIKLYPSEINWDKNVFYFTLTTPIKSIEYSEVDEDHISCSLSPSELIINTDYPDKLGINVKALRRRVDRQLHDPNVIEQFILYVPDVEILVNQFPENFSKAFLFELTKGINLG